MRPKVTEIKRLFQGHPASVRTNRDTRPPDCTSSSVATRHVAPPRGSCLISGQRAVCPPAARGLPAEEQQTCERRACTHWLGWHRLRQVDRVWETCPAAGEGSAEWATPRRKRDAMGPPTVPTRQDEVPARAVAVRREGPEDAGGGRGGGEGGRGAALSFGPTGKGGQGCRQPTQR